MRQEHKHMKQHGFGRIARPDKRDKLYPMSLVLSAVAPIVRDRYWWTVGPTLDQGDTAMCTGYAWAAWLQALPIATRLTWSLNGKTLYEAEKKIDGMPDVAGSTVRAGVEVLRSLGRVTNYLWAESLSQLKDWVLSRGPVVVGSDWFEGMMNPVEGVIRPTGDYFGGHAYLLYGYAAPTDCFYGINSWGRNWGFLGNFKISAGDLWGLIEEYGEACAAVEKLP